MLNYWCKTSSIIWLSVLWTWLCCMCVRVPGCLRVSSKTNTADELDKHLNWPQISFCSGTTFDSVGQCLCRGYTAVCTHTAGCITPGLSYSKHSYQKRYTRGRQQLPFREILMFSLLLDSVSLPVLLTNFCFFFPLNEIQAVICNVSMSAPIAFLRHSVSNV